MKSRFLMSALMLLAALVLPVPGRAAEGDGSNNNNQIEDNLSSYTGQNAEGYLGPLRDALGASLNSGIFMYAGVPPGGFHLRVELKGMLVNFGDDDKVFDAKTEDYFGDERTVKAPTVVGDEHSKTVTDPSTGASFTFPGGFNIDRFALAVPQITVGSIAGTEAVGRYITADTGDNEIGDIKLIGVGLRHDLSSHMDLPIDLTLTGFWQQLKVGSDFIKTDALTLGGQVGKHFGLLGTYAGLSYDSVKMNVRYDTNVNGADEEVNIDFDKKSSAHLTLGATLKLGFVHLNGEYNQASNTSVAFGLALGN